MSTATLKFVLAMAVRETRAAWKRMLFFFVCVAIGVASIVALRSVLQSVRGVLATEARTLLAADILITTNRPWSTAVLDTLRQRLGEGVITERVESVETTTMARPADPGSTAAKTIELRGIGPGFPLYGRMVLADGQTYRHELVRDRGALVRPELLTQLGLRVGDRIIIGRREFTIRGVVLAEPGRRMGTFTLGPRVFIDHADLMNAELLTFGSRAQYQVLLRAPQADIEVLRDRLRDDFRGQFVNVRSYRSTEENIGEDLLRAENYLSLVGLVIVVLGGIAVSSVTQVFVQQKIKSIAILKCLGAGSRRILAVYLLQVMVLGLAGSLLGVALAALAIEAVPSEGLLIGNSSMNVTYGLTPAAVLQGLGIGLLVSLLFAIVPLLEIRHVKPSLLLRREAVVAPGRDWLRLGVAVGVSAALVALASWQAASIEIGLSVSAGFVALAVVLHFAGRGVVRLMTPLSRSTWFPLRQASLRLTRPGNQTRVILLAVGLGSFFIIGVQALQRNLLDEFALDVRADGADMFLIDIQTDQLPGLRTLLDRHGQADSVRLIPVLRARVTAVKGAGVTLESYEDVRGRGSLAREYVITYRDRLQPNETITRGRFWGAGARPPAPEVSIEQGIHERFGIELGDTMRFDVLGRVITATVTSIRTVDWRDSRSGGFMFVFSPGVFEQAPHMHVAFFKGPADARARGELQHQVALGFPNVSVIDLREVLETVERVLSNVTMAISVVGGLVVLCGCLILVGAVAMTKFQRVYEAAIFKTLGATTRMLASMLVLEYGLLGLVAGTVGSLGAIALSWGVSRYALEITWRPTFGINALGIVLSVALVAIIGAGASLDVLRRKPIGALRAE
jgi:putative ABC transport system permease protein